MQETLGFNALRIALSFFPVTIFLCALLYLDSYKLVRLRTIVVLIALGGAAAAISYFMNSTLSTALSLEPKLLARYVAPVIEEVAKMLPLLLLLRARRIGFLVDASIFGFAIGTGFALLENIYFLWALENSTTALWVVRGFGTAIMHGGTTAIFAIVTKTLMERKEREALWLALPGLTIAVAIHSSFNHFVISPAASAVAIMFILPPLLIFSFAQSEKFMQSWLGTGFDVDTQLLEAMKSGNFVETRVGRYLQSLREHFDGAVLADMLCYVRLYAELSLRAKGILMMREAGFDVKPDEELVANLAELQYLRKSIGRTGELALAPVLQRSSHDQWQLEMLKSTSS